MYYTVMTTCGWHAAAHRRTVSLTTWDIASTTVSSDSVCIRTNKLLFLQSDCFRVFMFLRWPTDQSPSTSECVHILFPCIFLCSSGSLSRCVWTCVWDSMSHFQGHSEASGPSPACLSVTLIFLMVVMCGSCCCKGLGWARVCVCGRKLLCDMIDPFSDKQISPVFVLNFVSWRSPILKSLLGLPKRSCKRWIVAGFMVITSLPVLSVDKTVVYCLCWFNIRPAEPQLACKQPVTAHRIEKRLWHWVGLETGLFRCISSL